MGNRILIYPDTAEAKTKSGIIIPESAKQKTNSGKVVAVGNCQYINLNDRVLFANITGANNIDIDGIDYIIIRETDVLLVL